VSANQPGLFQILEQTPAVKPGRPAARAVQKRGPDQRQQILDLLIERGEQGVRNTELNKICFRYGARIFELRKLGHDIKTVKESDGLYRFVLKVPA
jgi:hypothetical protein